ncbi:hypothetical protein A2154_01450 [Candidatus Gottesmanbacteria bacterium RBG_16_43_7]|uniref:histidine kinase n=1 Tax=Candidatus Gottesmanbacteria bacterium RBG_16_43_7 TaxID=1798373 RepID=A0A1F5ZB95_9BACT|nr:MAG: hypothetical protein A2154_01450 [Candidatus Gottesmanbacteria bacterium RBG_16_43_7]
MQGLSESLLTLSAFETDTAGDQFENVALGEILEEAIGKIKPLAREKHITIVNNVISENLNGNHYRLTDLFMILLDNAVKYSPNKSRIRIDSQKKDGKIEIRVTDQGIGMSVTEQKQIFKRFYRSDSARSKNKNGGYGLGLAIAKKVVESHKGTITVTSQVGAGSTFTVMLPKARINS